MTGVIKDGVGKHSAGTRAVFWRTLALSMLKWLMISVLPILAVIGGWNWLSNRNSASSPPEGNPAIVGGDAATGPPSSDVSPGERLAPSQILNGANNPQWLGAAQKKLEDAGYRIVTTGMASRPYDKTTVFYQDGHQTGADDLARLVEATVTQPAPETLDKNIALTLVIGADFRP